MNRYLIDTNALRQNIRYLKSLAKDSIFFAVLKGNAYGLGTVPMATVLKEEGINYFAVAEITEAQALREAGFTDEILFLRSISDKDSLNLLLKMHCTCCVGSLAAAEAISITARKLGLFAKVHLQIDTGMGRYGFSPEQIEDIRQVYRFPNIEVTGIMTHFYAAFTDDDATRKQFQEFTDLVDHLRRDKYEVGIVHAANSSAFLRLPETRLDGVRLGSAILGRLAFSNSLTCPLTRIGCIETAIENIQELPKGHHVGYGTSYFTKKPTRVAIVPVGYYHGFAVERGQTRFTFRDVLSGSRSLFTAWMNKKKLTVSIGEYAYPVIGQVGMLHTAVDITGTEYFVGEKVRMEAKPMMVKDMDTMYL